MQAWQHIATPHERVHLAVPGVGGVPARVVRAVPGAAELLLLSPGEGGPGSVPARFLHGRACRLTSADPGAAGSLDGRVVAVRTWDGGLHSELVHVVFTAVRSSPVRARPAPFTPSTPAPAPTRPAQRRAFHRAAVVTPVTLVPVRFRVGWLDGRTRDLSAGGALVSGAERLREGDRLRVLLELGPDELLDTDGQIIRIDAAGLAGMKMGRLSAADRERLVRYVTLRQRDALAALRHAR